MKKKVFVAYISSAVVRDVQVYHGTDNECPWDSDDWGDAENCALYLGVYTANSEQEMNDMRNKLADEKCVLPEFIELVEISE